MEPDEKPWELVVVGAGSAGLTAARTARLLGAEVLLIERHRWGGDCLWTGCVPSKSLIAQARRAPPARRRSAGVLEAHDVFTGIDSARESIAPDDSPEALRGIGVRTLQGEAMFTGDQSMIVGGRSVEFTRAIVATGSRPSVPGIPGLAEVDPLTSDTIWELRELPERMVVVGGGAIACELGQALARLGVQVTIILRGPDILPGEIPEARELVRSALEVDGVRVLTGRCVVRFHRDASQECAALLDDGTRVDADRVLVATGRRAGVDQLGLIATGVETDDCGWISCDPTLRTDNPSIWAAGDVTWLPKHAHVAGVSGAVAARNALLGTRRTMHDAGAPRVLFTAPEIASVGTQEPTGRDRVATVRHVHVDRAVAEDDTAGFTRIIVDRRGRILGGTIVGPRAGETLGELTLAVDQGITVQRLTSVMHSYPTYSDGLWNAAIQESQRRLREGMAGRLASLMRRRASWRARRGVKRR
ncbi:oxidoreductase [Brachybacterium vulturis]|uniref:Oxidoreductase n=1 Tax=Brachybacterium vulturis TaxID=2017484 RepID=A0A291GSS9_9MICO|nr:FAD-dependent oxidoreductase [Brachybacterium vulturis]ATG53210.1 oxidoreductase [Brachybacterium vulturis]